MLYSKFAPAQELTQHVQTLFLELTMAVAMQWYHVHSAKACEPMQSDAEFKHSQPTVAPHLELRQFTVSMYAEMIEDSARAWRWPSTTQTSELSAAKILLIRMIRGCFNPLNNFTLLCIFKQTFS